MDEQTTAAVVDSTDAQEQQPAGATPGKTFTQAELDGIVKSRIDKQNAKHAGEVDSLNAKIAELTKRCDELAGERDALNAKAQRDAILANVAAEYGIDASVLRGDTEDEIKAHAEQLKSVLNSTRSVRGGEEIHHGGGTAPRDIFAEWMKNNS